MAVYEWVTNMNQKGFFLLSQIIILSIILLTSSMIFTIFQLYARSQNTAAAHLTAVYFARREISISEGRLLAGEKNISDGILTDYFQEKNDFTFHIKTTLATSGVFKIITTTIYWQSSAIPTELILIKILYEN